MRYCIQDNLKILIFFATPYTCWLLSNIKNLYNNFSLEMIFVHNFSDIVHPWVAQSVFNMSIKPTKSYVTKHTLILIYCDVPDLQELIKTLTIWWLTKLQICKILIYCVFYIMYIGRFIDVICSMTSYMKTLHFSYLMSFLNLVLNVSLSVRFLELLTFQGYLISTLLLCSM